METTTIKPLSVWGGMLKCKCPRCRQGDMFIHPNPYAPGKMLKMHKNCPVCGQTYTPEPGFYFGAAYISYIILVAVSVAAFLVMFFLAGVRDAGKLIAVLIALAILIAPLNYRWSRVVWAYIFIRYRPGSTRK